MGEIGVVTIPLWLRVNLLTESKVLGTVTGLDQTVLKEESLLTLPYTPYPGSL